MALIHFDEKSSAAPDISPGIVEDKEFLIREMFNPEHIVNGELIERAMMASDLQQNGFSVHRIRYVKADFIKASTATRLAKPRQGQQWKSEGVAKLKTLEVRRLRVDNKQAFLVIDTAKKTNPGHASIYVSERQRGKSYARELRSLLLPLLQNRMSVDEAYQQAS